MLVKFEAEVTGVIKHTDGSVSSCVSWKRNKWSNESTYIDQKLELGTKVQVIITNEELVPIGEVVDPICDSCGQPASAHSNSADDFSHCPSLTSESVDS